jgi:hypothetical protein
MLFSKLKRFLTSDSAAVKPEPCVKVLAIVIATSLGLWQISLAVKLARSVRPETGEEGRPSAKLASKASRQHTRAKKRDIVMRLKRVMKFNLQVATV